MTTDDGDGLSEVWAATPDEIRSTYDRWVSEGDYDDDVTRWGYRIPDLLAGIVATAAPDGGDGLPVLDAGCGSGLGGLALARAGVERVVGGDVSTESLAVAAGRNVYEQVVHLDLNAPLDFDDASFAGVMSSGVFTYVTDPAGTLGELLRVAADGAPVAFSQRTDLWESRGYPEIIDALAASGSCRAEVSDPVAYLPGHPEFGDDIGVVLTTLHRTVAA